MKFSLFHPMVHYGEDTLNIAELYEQSLVLTEYAEKLGFDSVFYNEGHKNHPNFRLPNPRILIGSAAQRTSTIKLGTGLTITTYNDPKLVIEDAAMLDALTNGRFVFGLGSGFDPNELIQFGINPKHRSMYSQLNESIILALMKAKLTGETVSVKSEFRNTQNTEVSIPIDPSLRSRVYKGTIYAESCLEIGKQGMGLMLSVSDLLLDDSIAFYNECMKNYRVGWSQSELKNEPLPEVYTMTIVHPMEDEDAASKLLPDYIARYKAKIDKPTTLPPCGNFYQHYLKDPMVLIGGIDRVKAKVQVMQQMGVQNVLGIMNTGGIPHNDVMKSMTLLSQECI